VIPTRPKVIIATPSLVPNPEKEIGIDWMSRIKGTAKQMKKKGRFRLNAKERK